MEETFGTALFYLIIFGVIVLFCWKHHYMEDVESKPTSSRKNNSKTTPLISQPKRFENESDGEYNARRYRHFVEQQEKILQAMTCESEEERKQFECYQQALEDQKAFMQKQMH